MLKLFRGIIERRRERQRRRVQIAREMGGMPPRHLMHIGPAKPMMDSRGSQSTHEGILARRHFSR